jgi:acetyl esterase
MRPRSLGLPGLIFLGFSVAGCATNATSPPQALAETSEPVAHVYRDVEGQSLRAYVFTPPRSTRSPRPAILFFHGGGWSTGSAEWTFQNAQRFANLGVVSIAIDYRLSGGTTTPIESLDDTCTAFHWARQNARELGIDPDRVGGYGVSAGGQLVAAAATLGCGSGEGRYANGGPDALLLWSPALNVAGDGWFGKLLQGRAASEAYSPVHHVPARLPPVSIVHGAEDALTPLPHARRFCELATMNGNRCELHVYPSVGHLLTRNLENQESDFDPDPAAREDGRARQERFIRELWLEAEATGSGGSRRFHGS